MLQHLITLTWNKKRKHALLVTEMLICFLVLFAVFTLLTGLYRNYRKPLGMEPDNLWSVYLPVHYPAPPADTLQTQQQLIRNSLLAVPGVQMVSFSSWNLPFYDIAVQNAVTYNGRKITAVNWYIADEHFGPVLGITMAEGRYYAPQDKTAAIKPLVITQALSKALFGDSAAVGKRVNAWGNCQIIGVTNDVKFQGDYRKPGYAVLQNADTSELSQLARLVVKVAPGSGYALEGKVYKILANDLKLDGIVIERMPELRKVINSNSFIPAVITCIVSVFLVGNVLLGLLGVLWYTISQRKGELALRRAVGATAKNIAAQLVTESLLLVSLALVPGVIIAVQFPLLHVFDVESVVYYMGLLLATAMLVVLVLLCALYPGRQAAAILPAVALHEE
ncbi:putative ABC transport system permease protein [Filimonas lacunae]|uniref:Putative ABC transport system permease protein n=1 Tax=Filimonas lacunae TaxID=477680 RepID=A0A173MMR7_9BACT|nr:ABC transporter permease [Filimonas lacunae]BAV08932.1 ABC transporter, permease protein [Filimonas lacunae]SIS64218.1 putative ABC transport system permease protein [Filimonas lacunae]